MVIPFLFLLICLCGCDTHRLERTPTQVSFNWQRINSRDEGMPSARFPLYSAKVPCDWIRVDPSLTDSIADTTKPLVEFYIEEGSEKIKISVHNFPSDSVQQRIPPIAQINRWRSQFEHTDPALTSITHQSRGGFVGLFLESQGTIDQKPIKLLGWAMQLAPEYYQLLSSSNSVLAKQERADYTIKAFGPPELVDKHRAAIIDLANNFELIEELPTQP